MKKRISNRWIIGIILGITVACQPAQNDLESARFLIDSIKSQCISDSRVEIFTITALRSGEGIILEGKTTSAEALTKLENQLAKQNIKYLDSIIRLPDIQLEGKIWGLINLSVANLRYTPAHSAEMATQALMGTPVRVLQEEDGWFLIQTPDRYIAWTESAGIALLTESELDTWKASDRLIFLEDNGLVLEAPDVQSRPVSDIVMGGILAFDGPEASRGQFLPVRLPDNRKGFVSRDACMDFSSWSSKVIPDSSALSNIAFRFIGRPYLWGGTSAKGFDCSGYTKSIYMTGGLILARDASQQVQQGEEIARENSWKGLKSGDLLFFGRTLSAELPEKVSHVGMYLGNSEFIHCSGMVRVNSLDSTRTNYKPYYRTNLLHVRRIINTMQMPATFNNHPWYQ